MLFRHCHWLLPGWESQLALCPYHLLGEATLAPSGLLRLAAISVPLETPLWELQSTAVALRAQVLGRWGHLGASQGIPETETNGAYGGRLEARNTFSVNFPFLFLHFIG